MSEKRKSLPNLSVVPNDNEKTEFELQLDKTIRPTEEWYPKIREDLIATEGKGDTVVVRTPEGTVGFPIYKLEWQIASLMNGNRNIHDITAEMAKLGLVGNPRLVLSFMRELKGYNFLSSYTKRELQEEKTNPALESPGALSVEERHLLSSALKLHERGDLGSACDYLKALLEINPSNKEVRSLLRQYETESLSHPSSKDLFKQADCTPTDENPRTERHPHKSKKWLVWAFVLFFLSGVFLTWATFFYLKDKIEKPSAGPTEKQGLASDVAKPLLRIERALIAIEQKQILAPRTGKILSLLVQPGDVVDHKQLLLTLGTPGLKKAISQATREYNQLKQRAKKNKSIMDFALDAKRRLDALKQRARVSKVEAPISGLVEKLNVVQGEAVEKDQLLVEIQDSSKLWAQVPKTFFQEKVEFYRCTVRNLPSESTIPCRLEEQANLFRFVLDNHNMKLIPGQVVQIEIEKTKNNR